MKVKICGITDENTAKFAIEHGADALGFVFAHSKRRISPQRAQEIIALLPKDVWKVGVFVNEKKEVIEDIVAKTGISAVQLHGEESPEDCEGFSVPVIKAFHISSEGDMAKINQYHSEYILLDSAKGKFYGGNGVSFDWSLLQSNVISEKNLILAGGLHEANVNKAIEVVSPYMVDVSSGVETNGKKDFLKIKEFIEIAKRRKGNERHLSVSN